MESEEYFWLGPPGFLHWNRLAKSSYGYSDTTVHLVTMLYDQPACYIGCLRT
uniref:Uncharacterized protein n=1 Tax=Octopus bimaculoides TaxID=37653 RepID=A0A0L8I0S6_OCTBM